MELKDHIAVFDNVLSDDYCKKIIEWFEFQETELIDNPELLVHKNTHEVRDGQLTYGSDRRKDISHFMNLARPTEETQKIKDIVNECVREYMIEYPTLSEYELFNTDIKIQKTPPKGGYHVWHHEHSGNVDSLSRVLVWTLYLNDMEDGEGETEFLHQAVKVKAKTGTLCIWPAAFTHLHRGNPPYSKDKYIATGWIKTLSRV